MCISIYIFNMATNRKCRNFSVVDKNVKNFREAKAKITNYTISIYQWLLLLTLFICYLFSKKGVHFIINNNKVVKNNTLASTVHIRDIFSLSFSSRLVLSRHLVASSSLNHRISSNQTGAGYNRLVVYF